MDERSPEALAAALLGAWELVEYKVIYADGRPSVFPFGRDARGRLIYAASGHVSAALSAEGRSPLGRGRLEDAHRASTDEKARAFDGYLSYAGRWRLAREATGWRVIHVIELALVPNVVGSEQVRELALDGDSLVLGYDVATRAGARRHQLAWRRAGGEA